MQNASKGNKKLLWILIAAIAVLATVAVVLVTMIAGNISGRCTWCYENRLEVTARYAAEHGFTHYTSTLLASLYQNHEKIVAAGNRFAEQYGVEFLYRDFRPNFHEGNRKARELGFYMQKYCGCVFSEEDRYLKQINRDKEKFTK